MRRRLWVTATIVVACSTVSGCGGCGDGQSGEAGGETAALPDAFGDRRVHFDLVGHVHLADVDHRGTFIDFGTPARAKYTVGQWRTGWVDDRTEGDVTFSHVEDTGRFFFDLGEAGPVTFRFRVKPIGSRNLSLFVNGNQQELVRLEEGDEFRDYDVTVPADHVNVGENYVLMRFGGTRQVDGRDVAVAVDSIRIVEGDAIPAAEYEAPVYGSLVREVVVGGDARRAVAVRRPTALSWYLQVPRGGSLGFGVGAAGESPAEAEVEAVVTPEGGAAERVFSADVSDEWLDEVVSLERWAGQIVRVDLRVTGEGEGLVGWSAASILVEPPEEREEQAPATNVVVLLIDTTRASKLRAFNSESRVQTPVLDRVARDGAVFTRAQSPENWTKPACASILTGLFPATHGTKTSEARLPDGALMLSEHLDANGFSTASFIANGYVSDRFGFDQGWDHYTNYIREGKNSDASNVLTEAGDWIEQHKDERFFVYVQTIDPHVPYDPPDEYLRMYDDREYTGQVRARMTPDLLERAKRDEITFDPSDVRRLEALHDGEITQHDFELGRFIERLRAFGVWEDTLFVVTSDHGEEFDEHGSWGHGHSLYQELLNVPLVFHLPGRVPAGVRVGDAVSTVSIPRTVLAYADVDPLPADEGVDLRPFMRGAQPVMPSVAFSDFLDDRRVIVAGDWKLVLNGINATFFDLANDPGEQREVQRAEHRVAVRYLRIMIGQFLGATDRSRWLDAEQGRGTRFETENAQMDDTIRDQLRALGYAN
jgi:arylsulfatase A-like enzyme